MDIPAITATKMVTSILNKSFNQSICALISSIFAIQHYTTTPSTNLQDDEKVCYCGTLHHPTPSFIFHYQKVNSLSGSDAPDIVGIGPIVPIAAAAVEVDDPRVALAADDRRRRPVTVRTCVEPLISRTPGRVLAMPGATVPCPQAERPQSECSTLRAGTCRLRDSGQTPPYPFGVSRQRGAGTSVPSHPHSHIVRLCKNSGILEQGLQSRTMNPH